MSKMSKQRLISKCIICGVTCLRYTDKKDKGLGRTRKRIQRTK